MKTVGSRQSAKGNEHESRITDSEFYRQELASNECACGRNKERNRSFCRRCYFSLPEDMRKALYARIGDGYEEAYEAAHSWLTENLW